jgi:WD40 repeat protein
VIDVWEISGEPKDLLFANPRDGSPAVALSTDGTRMASSLYVWDVDSGGAVLDRSRPFGSTGVRNMIGVTATAFSPDGRLLASSKGDLTVVDEVETGALVAELRHGGKETVAVAFGTDDSHLAILTNEKKPQRYVVRVWNVESGEVTFQESGEKRGRTLAFSPDGTRIAVAERDAPMIRVWDVESGEEVRRMPREGFPTSLAFVGDGSRLAAAEFTRIRFFDLESSTDS